MMEHSFELVPLPGPGIPDIKIIGTVTRERNVLSVQYSLSGRIDDIRFPELNPQPERKKELWLSTCFEFFLSFPDQPQYWEFNISPSGDWNAFHMDAYRQISLREEELLQTPQMELNQDAACYQLKVVVDLSPIVEEETQILVGVSSVIQTRNGQETYWALTHPGSQADFHLRESFLLAL